jgi:anti-sigma-K factor RskA
MAYSEDHIALAAEYALGTLDADERALVETMMSGDRDFTALVTAWEQKLGVLNQMVGSVEPRPELWQKIRVAAGLSEPPAPMVLAEAPPPAVAPPPPAAAVADSSNVIRLANRARRWRQVATLATGIAAALVAVIALGIYRPDLLPDQVRPKPRTQVVEI